MLLDIPNQNLDPRNHGLEQPKLGYVQDFNRIAKAVEDRMKILGHRPCLSEIPEQIALRSSLMKIATLRREISGLRAVIRYAMATETWPALVDDANWIQSASLEDIAMLQNRLEKAASEWIAIGVKLAPQRVASLLQGNFPGSESDALQALSGVFQERSRSASRDAAKQYSLTLKDLRELDFMLGDHPHKEALTTLSQDRVNSRAMLRIFMRTISLTGMRPTEVFDCVVMVGDPDRQYSKAEIISIRKKPYTSIQQGLLKPIDLIHPSQYGGLAPMVMSITQTTGVPPILVIKNAKQTNANSKIAQPSRVQIIENMEEEDLQVLCLAAHLHHFRVKTKRRSNLTSAMTRSLRRIAADALGKDKANINLYSFRHGFATRARLVMPVWEVAALMGHTAKASTYVYGKKYVRKRKSDSSSGGWMPSVDPENAERIHELWASKETQASQDLGSDANLSQDEPGAEAAPEKEVSFSISDL